MPTPWELAAITSLSGDESFMVTDDDDGTPVLRQVTVENLATGLAAQTGFSGTYVSAFIPQAYGAVADGATDDTTAVQAAITAAQAVGGGVVYFPPGHYRINGQLTFTTDGQAVPAQKSVRLTGAGCHNSGTTRAAVDFAASRLDMRYAGAGVGKVDTRGLGLLEIDHLAFIDGGASTVPFIHTTLTTLHVHDCSFEGNTTKSGATCDQDAIVCGGTTTTIDGTDDAPFQGYGTVIADNYFGRIRRGVYGRAYFNGVVIQNNTWWNSCGSDNTAAAIEIAGFSSGEIDTGIMVTGNLIEMVGYVYGVRAVNCSNCYFANSFYDFDAGGLSCYLFGDYATYNTVLDVFRPDADSLVTETGTADGTTTVITGHQGQTSVFTQNVDYREQATFRDVTIAGAVAGGGDAPTIQPAVALTNDAVQVFQVLRSAAEGVNPSTIILYLQQDGKLILGGDSAGAIDFRDEAGNVVAQFTSALKNWILAGDGGAMSQNSGAGGSYLTLRNYGVKLLDQGGANAVTIKNGSGSPEGAFAAPVGSIWLRTDGGTGSTFWVKETGAATNTGWVAK